MDHIFIGRTYTVPTQDGRIRATLGGIHLHGEPREAVPCSICGQLCKNYISFTEETEGYEVVVGTSCAKLVNVWTEADQ